MATLLLTAVGTLVGGPIGGALGALAGQQLDLAVIGTQARQGPRLKDLAVQTSSYGAAIPRHYGRVRAAGSVIWATELKESREKHGGGKGRPKTVTYSYASSFAVALASRPILGVGRIWADGSLLRGGGGDLKSAGTLRLHTGHGDQPPDPLLVAAEGAARCPAFRGLAYAVFEDLALADFGNRIPSLTFEVIADDGEVTLAHLLADVIPEAQLEPVDPAVTGYSIDGGTAADLVETISEVVPLRCTAELDRLVVGPAEDLASAPALPPEPVASDGEDGPRHGFSRQRAPLPARRAVALRYYDVARDFQPGIQRGRGRTPPGDAAVIEVPAALAAPAALAFADAASRRTAGARETASLRIAELDSRFAPGRVARRASDPARWLIESWEWSRDGVELGLLALPHSADTSAGVTDPGRANLPPDVGQGATELVALELPWDGVAASDTPLLFAAVSSAAAGWSGAALFVEQAEGSLLPLGPSGRRRATIGIAQSVLGIASPHAVDRFSTVEIALAGADMTLPEASLAQLAMGANRALIGSEIVQFARAAPLGDGRWRLSDLLRGRGGTEAAIAGHALGERFVLIDDDLVALDPALVGDAGHARIAALGLADPAPVLAPFALPGISLRPPSPVHGALVAAADGGVMLGWTRRARGAWLWRDGVEVPLVEQSEAYRVTFGDPDLPIAQWEVAEPLLALTAAQVAALRGAAPDAVFEVRQRGDRSLSAPLPLGPLP